MTSDTIGLNPVGFGFVVIQKVQQRLHQTNGLIVVKQKKMLRCWLNKTGAILSSNILFRKVNFLCEEHTGYNAGLPI